MFIRASCKLLTLVSLTIYAYRKLRKGSLYMSKMVNMLSILWLLKTRKQLTAKELAEELEISIRTVYRYIDALCASGVPIIADAGHNGGYSLLNEFTKAPLFFLTWMSRRRLLMLQNSQ